MTTIEARSRPSQGVGRRFYLVMSLVMAATIVAGFSQTVPDDFTAHPGLPLLLHVHGAVFTLWVMLIVAQPALIAQGSIQRHRQLGMVGAGLASAMVIMGLAATLFAIRYHRVPSFFPVGVFLVMNSVGILTFAGLVTAAVLLRRKADWHKRLMICATVSILGPGLGRFLPMDSFGAFAPLVMFGVIILYALAGPAHDLITIRRVHPAYLWGAAAILIGDLAIAPLAFAPPTTAFIHWLRSA